MPDKLKEMQELFEQEAAKYNVLPLDNYSFASGHSRRARARQRAKRSSPIRA